MHKLVEYICEELEELERKADKEGKLSMAEVQYMDTLAHAKKNLLKSEEMMEDGYSMRGMSMARGRTGNVRRDTMGRYSREYDHTMHSYDHEMKSMIDSIHDIMPDLPEDAKHDAQRFVKRLESM